ncbi:MAG TPA: hypothetical protein VF721_12880 [Pyrinomonadaceae bacterium]|jgi:hypothetical protein
MSITVTFTPESMSSSQYEEIIKRLKQAGADKPRGRLFHVCHGDADHLRVLDVWNSIEDFQEFGQTLIPIIGEVGVISAEPEIREVYSFSDDINTIDIDIDTSRFHDL